MRTLLAFALLLGACKPDVGGPPSIVTGTRLLAVASDPAEVRPGDPVTFRALVASPDGDVVAPDIGWATCRTPKPLAENNIVGDACLGDGADQLPDRGPMIVAPIPDDACARFGSDTPPTKPGELPLRPRDPDVTGGFYQPMRAAVKDPGGNFVVAFALERITCNLANAPIEVVQDYRARYHVNLNPKIERVLVAPAGATSFDEPPRDIPAGATATLRVRWTADSPETYPVFDVISKTLVDHREAMRVSLYASDGSFEHDRTGRGETEMDTFADDVWTAPTQPGPVHLWAVLRDSRGGIDFASFTLQVVTP